MSDLLPTNVDKTRDRGSRAVSTQRKTKRGLAALQISFDLSETGAVFLRFIFGLLLVVEFLGKWILVQLLIILKTTYCIVSCSLRSRRGSQEFQSCD